ncbi:MAG: hypothetical protein ACK52I_16815 [Pseudomonadota bacterium]
MEKYEKIEGEIIHQSPLIYQIENFLKDKDLDILMNYIETNVNETTERTTSTILPLSSDVVPGLSEKIANLLGKNVFHHRFLTL